MDLTTANLLLVLGSIVISMGFHEGMHAFVAHQLGDTTASDMGRLTLNPLKHIDIYTTVLLPLLLLLMHLPPFFIAKPVPFNPARVKYEEYGAALIGIAGPLTNFALAGVAAIILRLSGLASSSGIFNAIVIFIEINLAFFVFNMIPFPPLDGSRLLYAFAPEPLQNLMYSIERGGLLMIVAFMFLLFPVIGPMIIAINEHLLRLLLG